MALVIFLIVFFALSIGMVFGKTQIKGHCGNPGLDSGCADSDPQPLEFYGESIPGDRCVVDQFGNKTAPCATCACEDQ